MQAELDSAYVGGGCDTGEMLLWSTCRFHAAGQSRAAAGKTLAQVGEKDGTGGGNKGMRAWQSLAADSARNKLLPYVIGTSSGMSML